MVGVLSWDNLAFNSFAWGDKMYLLVVVRSRGILCSFKWVRDDLFSDVDYLVQSSPGLGYLIKQFAS
jgi:hypothetical protein